jgi:predicted AlkP superfamily pyrophosphatase or phosphodiesterase
MTVPATARTPNARRGHTVVLSKAAVSALFMVAVLAALLVATVVGTAAAERHVVIISIDALRPEFYLDASFGATELRALMAAGTAARGAEGVFPTVTYPNHASIATGVRPLRHGVAFNVLFDPVGERGRWYEEAADLRATPIWEWARAAGLRTASVSWPSTLGARIDSLVPERNYYARRDPIEAITSASTPGLFSRLGVTPAPDVFTDAVKWDAFLAGTASALIRAERPHLLLIHMVQADFAQHRGGRSAPDLQETVARLDGHVGSLRRALREAGIAERAVVIVTGDHGFQDIARIVYPSALLARAGLRGCPRAGETWRATIHTASGSAAVFVSASGGTEAAALAERTLRAGAGDRYTVLTRAELDALGAMPGAALGLEAAPGWMIGGGCGRGRDGSVNGGTHGFLPTRDSMLTGFIAAGAGVRAGVLLDRIHLVDIAPTTARLLGLTPPAVEGHVLEAILE